VTNHYQLSVVGPANQSLTFDANGNMTSDGTNSYAWDCENRLIRVTYVGTGNFSQFVYDGLDHNVQIVETRGGSVTNTKQFVWCGNERCETRDATGAVTAQYFVCGQTIGSANYYCSKDHLGSVIELTDSSGSVQASYKYDSWGRTTKLQGSLDSDFQYAGYYFHASSGLCLTVYRAYNSVLGRWINRDPVEESAGSNLFAYVRNGPTISIDPSGMNNVGAMPWNPMTWLPPGWYQNPIYWTPGLVIDPELIIPIIIIIVIGGGVVYSTTTTGSGTGSGTGQGTATTYGGRDSNPCIPPCQKFGPGKGSLRGCTEWCITNCPPPKRLGCFAICQEWYPPAPRPWWWPPPLPWSKR
jgi:RHS repeat-associated protein